MGVRAGPERAVREGAVRDERREGMSRRRSLRDRRRGEGPERVGTVRLRRPLVGNRSRTRVVRVRTVNESGRARMHAARTKRRGAKTRSRRGPGVRRGTACTSRGPSRGVRCRIPDSTSRWRRHTGIYRISSPSHVSRMASARSLMKDRRFTEAAAVATSRVPGVVRGKRRSRRALGFSVPVPVPVAAASRPARGHAMQLSAEPLCFRTAASRSAFCVCARSNCARTAASCSTIVS